MKACRRRDQGRRNSPLRWHTHGCAIADINLLPANRRTAEKGPAALKIQHHHDRQHRDPLRPSRTLRQVAVNRLLSGAPGSHILRCRYELTRPFTLPADEASWLHTRDQRSLLLLLSNRTPRI
ncbi:hypothetical protein NDU88_007635 [Pleurodeles waltl]|uniref:Uncharacterized protein n=1 Tax=Pleurodeles waltl TaxID=8319 RepID=A0AAV7RTL4_PLEWA|nr:hypothetical protein NDU88_007635 [Pleurodeles waltl]